MPHLGALNLWFLAMEGFGMEKKLKRRRVPGWWRGQEAREEIEAQTGTSINKRRWEYLLDKKIIPEGEGRVLLTDGSASLRQMWSDKQLYMEIIPTITAQAPADSGHKNRSQVSIIGLRG